MPVLNTGLAKVSGEAFTIDQSLRFNDDDTAYLSWTPAGAGNQRTWTWSGWVKRGNLGTNNTFFAARTGASGTYLTVGINSSDELLLQSNSETSYPLYKTNALFRDASAWFNIIVSMDTTQSTSTNRLKVYVNGTLQTTASYNVPAQNTDLAVNSTSTHLIGQQSSGSYIDGYLAEVHFIDGTALDHTSFGETGDYGEWKPKEYDVADGAYGTNGFYLSFAGGGIMSATGGDSTDTDGDYKAASFTQDGTFTPSADGEVEYLVIAGGGSGGGGNYFAGGGGAGGFRTGYLAVTGGTAYSITVGDGGAGGSTGTSNNGSNSVFSSITSIGGGGGGLYNNQAGKVGGSGGGGAGYNNEYRFSGAGTAGQGYAGGDGHGASIEYSGGGGGGASAVGGDGTSSAGGVGGAGLASSITGSSVTYAGGGGGSGNPPGTAGAGGAGGGGAGSTGAATNGTANTGGGGGGAEREGAATSGAGGSGIVIIRYKFQ